MSCVCTWTHQTCYYFILLHMDVRTCGHSSCRGSVKLWRCFLFTFLVLRVKTSESVIIKFCFGSFGAFCGVFTASLFPHCGQRSFYFLKLVLSITSLFSRADGAAEGLRTRLNDIRLHKIKICFTSAWFLVLGHRGTQNQKPEASYQTMTSELVLV